MNKNIISLTLISTFIIPTAYATSIALPSGTTTWTTDQVFDSNGRTTAMTSAAIRANGTNAVITNSANINATNSMAGVLAFGGGTITINNTGDYTLTATGNYINPAQNDGGAGIQAGTETLDGGYTIGHININGMNIVASNNQRGVFAANGTINLIGATGLSSPNTLTVWDNNHGSFSGGIISTGVGGVTALINIENMDINVGGAQQHGIQAFNGGDVTIIGLSDGSNTITATNNQINNMGNAIYSSGAGSVMTINNMNIIESGSMYGIIADNLGVMNITGLADGSNSISVTNNAMGTTGVGIYASGNPSGASAGASKINISNTSITSDGNYGYGVMATGNAQINITGVAGNTFSASGNGSGLYINNNANNVISITGFDSIALNNNTIGSGTSKQTAGNGQIILQAGTITASGNNGNGLSVLAGDSVTAGAGGLFADGNKSTGIIANTGGNLILNGGAMSASNNGAYGLVITGGTTVTLNGAGNAFTFNNNVGDGIMVFNTTSILNISDAAISALTNSGFGINNIGTVNFSNTVSVDGVIAGNGIITNTGNLALLSDDSAFTGIFNQTAGETTVGVSARMLGGTNNISNSTLNVTSIAGIYYNATLGTNGILNNYSALIAAQNIDTSKISFAAGATGATMNFGRDATLAAANNLANYNLTGYIANSAGNTVSFSDSNISFDPTNMAGVTTYDFTDGTNYVFNDSVIDLTNTGTNVRTFNVGNMATYNSTLSFSLMLTGSGNPYTEFISDKLNVTNYTGDTLALGTIKILNPSAEDGLTGPFYIQDILSGAQFTAGQTASFATTVYQYLATVDAPQTGLELDIVGESDENSLYIMNDNYHSAGVRGFNFSLTNETYNIGKSLSATNAGTFVVQGYNDDATNSILSGEILAGYYGGQNLKGSFFNLSGLNGDVAFTLQNLTIQDAYTFAGDDITFGDSSDPAYDSGPNGNDGYGSVLKITDANSTALIQNVIAQRNTAQFEGGAIYAMDGLTVLSMTQFLHNTAQTGSGGAIYNEADVRIRNGAIFDGNNALAGLGGAIYNSGTLLLDSTFGDIVFENNSDSTGANDIYGDDDSIININGTAGTVAIYSGITGLGEINKTGTGTFDIYADSSAYTGTFTQTDGITNVYTSGFFMGDTNLSGGIINFAESASAGAMNVSNGGIVNLRGTDFNTLTVTDWSGGNGYLWLNTYFDGNGTSTDKLVVAGGDATGTTTLFINSVGTNNVVTPDGEYGIMVVDLTNAFDKSAIFTLNGGMIDTGAYEYHLVKELDDNWYLETDWTPTSVAQTAGAIPIIHLAVVKAGMNELRKRLGELRGDDKSRHNGVWVRTYGKSKNIHKYIDADLDLLGIEGGYDHQFNVDSGRIYVGVMAGMLESRDIRIHQSNGHTGRGTTSAPSVGAYATWVHKSGSPNKWFIDATVRHFWVDTDLKNIASNGQTVSYDIDRNFIASSLETGKLFYFRAPEFANIGTKQNSHMSMEPKAEVRFKYAPSKNATTNFGDDIHIDSTTGLNTKLALQTNYLPNGTQSVWKPWIEIGVFREWLGNENVGFGGAQIHTSARGNGMELAAGTNVSLGERSYGFAGFTYETGEVYTSYQLNIGARMKF